MTVVHINTIPGPATVADRLRDLREEAGETVPEITRRCGLPRGAWQKWENAEMKPGVPALTKIALALELPDPVIVWLIIGPPGETLASARKRSGYIANLGHVSCAGIGGRE